MTGLTGERNYKTAMKCINSISFWGLVFDPTPTNPATYSHYVVAVEPSHVPV